MLNVATLGWHVWPEYDTIEKALLEALSHDLRESLILTVHVDT